MDFVSFENHDLCPTAQSIIHKQSTGQKWRLLRKLSSGSYGIVYVAKEEASGAEVAVKLEPAPYRTLYHESQIYQSLKGVHGFAKMFHINSSEDNSHHIMVMELLGPNLAELFDFCHRKFSLQTVCLLGLQMLQRLRELHYHGFLHRDVKPENFLIGVGPTSQCVYLIDFGLAKQYFDPHRQRHMPYSEGRRLTGSAHFVSVNTHLGIEPSRRDDLESLCYCLLYFLQSDLPWHNFKAGNKRQKQERISEKMLSLSVAKLCADVPPEMADCLTHCRNLDFEETPNYDYLASKLLLMLQRTQCLAAASPSQLSASLLPRFDWEIAKEQVCKFVSQAAPVTTTMFMSTRPNPSVAVRLDDAMLAAAGCVFDK